MTLIVGPEKVSIPAHRTILTAHSEVFRAMLQPNSMREGETGVVELPNCSESTVKRLLQYFYINEVRNIRQCTLEVINIAVVYLDNF